MYKDVAPDLSQFEIKYPKTIVPVPEESDYNRSYLLRYFTRKANDEYGHVFELDEDTYDEYLENPFWISTSLKWRIAGPLYTTYNENGTIKDIGVIAGNKASLSKASINIKNISLYLPNLKQYYRGI